jgi:CRP-like cAMP-binding protein
MENWYLKEADILKFLNKDEQKYLFSHSYTKQYKRNELFLLAGQETKSICYIHSGKVKTYFITKEGNEVTLFINYPCQLFGLSAFYDTLRCANHKTLKDSLIRFIPTEIFDELVSRNQELAYSFIKIIGARMHFLALQIQDLTMDVQSRLANILLKMSYQNGIQSNDYLRITPNLTHEELGSFINARRQTVTSILNSFERDGIIRRSRDHIIIIDLEKLKALVGDGDVV